RPVSLPDPPPRKRLRLLVPGRVRKGKGGDLLQAMLPEIGQHAELVLLGAGAEGMDFFGRAGVHVVLNYQREDLPRLVASLRPDAALIVPTVAETFSYTLSEMRNLGLPVIATAVGALAERIEDGVDGLLVAPDARALLERIAGLCADRKPLEVIRQHLSGQVPAGLETMLAAYRHLLPADGSEHRYQPSVAGLDAEAVQ